MGNTGQEEGPLLFCYGTLLASKKFMAIGGLLEGPWRREWLPTPVFLPGEFNGQGSLVGYSPWGCKESDMIELLTHFLEGVRVCFWSGQQHNF